MTTSLRHLLLAAATARRPRGRRRAARGAAARARRHRHLPVRDRRPGRSACRRATRPSSRPRCSTPARCRRPTRQKGFGGKPIELVIIDEAGGPQKQVTEFRNLAPRVDLVIGYISSGDCLAIAPVAEELKKLTVLFDCGTPRIFEDASYKYVFRTGAHAHHGQRRGSRSTCSSAIPNVKSIAGINQNYAWGQDSWTDFEAAMKALKPGIEVKTSQMPKLFAGQFGAEISTLLASGADVIHSSFWGGDLEGLVLQGAPRGLFEKHKVMLSAGEPAINRLGTKIPDGTIIGARGPFGPFAPDTELSTLVQEHLPGTLSACRRTMPRTRWRRRSSA